MPRFSFLDGSISFFAFVTYAIFSSSISASTKYESLYTFDQTFGAALRLIRIDMGLTVLEKSSEEGYIMFDYVSPESGKKIEKGSVEIVSSNGQVQAVVSLPNMPKYHEEMIKNRLAKKLLDENGPAVTNKISPPQSKTPDETGGAPSE